MPLLRQHLVQQRRRPTGLKRTDEFRKDAARMQCIDTRRNARCSGASRRCGMKRALLALTCKREERFASLLWRWQKQSTIAARVLWNTSITRPPASSSLSREPRAFRSNIRCRRSTVACWQDYLSCGDPRHSIPEKAPQAITLEGSEKNDPAASDTGRYRQARSTRNGWKR